MRFSCLILSLAFITINVFGTQKAVAINLGSLFQEGSLNNPLVRASLQHLANNALDIAESFVNNPDNQQTLEQVVNSWSSSLNQPESNALDTSNFNTNFLNQIVSNVLTGTSSISSPSNNTLTTDVINYLIDLYVESMTDPSLTKARITTLVIDFIANKTNNNQMLISYLNATLPAFLDQISPMTPPQQIMELFMSSFNFSSFLLNNVDTYQMNSEEFRALLDSLINALFNGNFTDLGQIINNLNATQMQQLFKLLSNPHLLADMLGSSNNTFIQELLYQIMSDRVYIERLLEHFGNQSATMQMLVDCLRTLMNSTDFQQLIELFQRVDVYNLICNRMFCIDELIPVLQQVNVTEWSQLLYLIKNPAEFNQIISLVNSTKCQQFLQTVYNLQMTQEFIESLNTSQILKYIYLFSVTPLDEALRERKLDIFIKPYVVDILADFFGITTVDELFQMLNLTDSLTPEMRNHLEIYLPDFFNKLNMANSSEEVYMLLEQTALYHFSLYFNDSAIMNSSMPWLCVAKNAILMTFAQSDFEMMISEYLRANNMTYVLDMFSMHFVDQILSFFTDVYNVRTVDDMFQLLNINVYNLTDMQRMYLEEAIPQLIAELSRCNSTEEIFAILENAALGHFSVFFNDSSILNSSMPWACVLKNALFMALNNADLQNEFIWYMEQNNMTFWLDLFNTTNMDQLLELINGLNTISDLEGLFDYFNYNLTDLQRRHLRTNIPKLLAELSAANSSDEMAAIIEQKVLFHLSMFLNDSSLNYASDPWTAVANRLFYLLLNDPMIMQQINESLAMLNITELQDVLRFFDLDQIITTDMLDWLIALYNTRTIDEAIRLFNLTDMIGPNERLFLETYLPELLESLMRVNNSQELHMLLERALLVQLSYVFNDSLILSSSQPWFIVGKNVFFKLLTDPQVMNNIENLINNQQLLDIFGGFNFSNWISEESLMMLAELVRSEDLSRFILQFNLTDSQRDHVTIYIPQLIESIMQANDSMEVLMIIENTILYHVALYTNNSNLMNTTNPCLTLAMIMINNIVNNPELTTFLDIDPHVHNFTMKLLTSYFESMSMRTAMDQVKPAFAELVATILTDPSYTFVDEYAPDLSRALADSKSEEESMSLIGDFLVSEVRAIFPKMSTTTLSTTVPTTTTTMTTATTTTTTTTTTTPLTINPAINSIIDEIRNSLTTVTAASTVTRVRNPVVIIG